MRLLQWLGAHDLALSCLLGALASAVIVIVALAAQGLNAA
jgi:hypothetical protein